MNTDLKRFADIDGLDYIEPHNPGHTFEACGETAYNQRLLLLSSSSKSFGLTPTEFSKLWVVGTRRRKVQGAGIVDPVPIFARQVESTRGRCLKR